MDIIGDYGSLYPEMLKLIQEGRKCALATVVDTSGSTPQKPGSKVIVGEEGLISGTVGGGPVEYKVIELARQALATGMSGYFGFNLDQDDILKEESVCGGKMTVMIDAFPGDHAEVFQKMINASRNRETGILVSNTQSMPNQGLVIRRLWLSGNEPTSAAPEVIRGVEQLLLLKRPGETRMIHLTDENQKVFLEFIALLPKLFIAGAGHVGRAVAHLGKWLGFEVTVWDDRPDYSDAKLLQEADYILNGSPEELPGKLNVDSETFIVIVSRGHRYDARVLHTFINSDAAYIGMIGSRKKTGLIRDDFLKNSWTIPKQWEKVHTPIGLPIGSVTVREIAISIAAEIIKVRNGYRGNN